jgi:hypothetical protein
MIFTPLFTWGVLIKAIFLPRRFNFDDIAHMWIRGAERYIWLSRSMWSIVCIVKLRKIIRSKKQPVIWIPDFFCNGSLAAVRQEGAKLIFYPINENLSPNLDACEKIANTDDSVPDIVIAVHYFGVANDLKGIARLCKKYDAWLVEDAAHVLAPISGVGEIGDFVCYSPHKHLPIPDGALLVIRKQGISKPQLDESEYEILYSIVLQLPNKFFERLKSVALWIAKRVAQKIGVKRNKVCDNFYIDSEVGAGIQYVHMSLLSKKMLAFYVGSLDEVAANRRQLIRKLDILFSLSIFKNKFIRNDLRGQAYSPYLMPYQILDTQGGNFLFSNLQKLGLPVSSWPDLPPEIFTAPIDHCIAIEKRNKYFYIASHQSILNSELRSLFKKVASIDLAGWAMSELNEDQWFEYFKSSINPSLLQTWEFGSAKQAVGSFKVRHFLVQSNKGEAVAIAQIMTLKIPLLGEFAYLNQGPIFLTFNDPFKSNLNELFFFNTIKTLFYQARKFGFQLLYIAPTIRASQEGEFFLGLLGLRKLFARNSWGSAILRLDQTFEELMSSLARNWRGHLRKSQQLGIDIQSQNIIPKNINFLIGQYKILQKNKKFIGINENLIRSLAMQSKEQSQWKFNLFTAHEPDKLNLEESIGLIVTIEFHDTAIYLIGLTSEVGRKVQANYALLWFAILHAKDNKLKYFDMGGVNQETSKGISDFKYGTGATPFSLIGEWRPKFFGL